MKYNICATCEATLSIKRMKLTNAVGVIDLCPW